VIPSRGMSHTLLCLSGPKGPSKQQTGLLASQPKPGLAIIEPFLETLYGDCDPREEAALEAGMTPHAYRVFETKATAPC
jgi:hypothetical protein